jgi:hypothetical protein
MPLFKCSQCGCVENTALGKYWYRKAIEKLPPLCSECSTGEWHGQFPKQTPEECGYIEGPDGFWGTPEEINKLWRPPERKPQPRTRDAVKRAKRRRRKRRKRK